MGRLRHSINCHSGEVYWGTKLGQGINIARGIANGYSITGIPVKSVIHVLF
jgi:hypothetical protein